MKQTYNGSCHCGNIRFEVDMKLDHVRVCDCSVCHKRGALNHRVSNDDLRVLSSFNDMTLYQWHTKTAEDYFCKHCGILPFRQPRGVSKTEQAAGIPAFTGWAVNVRCLEGVDSNSLPIKHVRGSKLD